MASATFMSPPLDRNISGMEPPNASRMEALMNQTAGTYSSLYQSCLSLKRRLAEVRGLDLYLEEMDADEQESDDTTDIVTSVWNMLRLGYPLMELYNATNPPNPISVDSSTLAESKLGKAATFKFLQACMNDLGFAPGDCFLITDLYGRDTTGFVKVLKVVDRVFDILKKKGLLTTPDYSHVNGDNAQPQKLNFQENVIREIVTTERNYVHHLDTLQQFKDELERSGVVPGDVVHDIFMNLNALVDYQRRFLIRVEQQNCLDPSMQNWGRLFHQYAQGFRIYEPFIANQSQSNQSIIREWPKIKTAPVSPAIQGMLGDCNALTGFLLKPLQRITKYPLLLDQLIKHGDYDQERRLDLLDGKNAINEVVIICNEAAERASRYQEVAELTESVDDWKGHRLDHFGDLIISGQHTVLKGDTPKAEEREYKIFLFERILLCCKEINFNKPKNRLPGRNTNKTGKPRLQLKGRIFIQNITDIIKQEDGRATNKPYLLKVIWRGDPAIESFNVCFQNSELRDTWWTKATEQRDKLPRNRDPTSATEFASLAGANLPNPYYEPSDDVDDEEEPRLSNSSTLVTQAEYPTSKNASSTSLRSRSTTGGSDPRLPPSGQGLPTARPARFPLPEPSYPQMNPPPLKVATNFTPETPGDRAGTSYFSPIGDSPSSSSIRSSSQSGTVTPLPYRGQPTPVNGSRPHDGSKHNTAPPGTYHQERQAQRPQIPGAPHSSSHVPLSQSRSRSLSSSDIHQNQQSPSKRHMNGQMPPGAEDVPVPKIPAHMIGMRAPINRSQTSSPTEPPRYGRSQTPGNGYGYPPPNYGNPESHSRSNSRQGYHYTGPGPTPHGISQRVLSPALPSANSQIDGPWPPSQLKVKIHFEPKPNYMTIVVPFHIKYQTLIDRIDSKMDKVTTCSISKKTARIRYLDEEGAYVSIQNDDDVQIALDEWQDKSKDQLQSSVTPDFELFWHQGDGLRLMR